MTTFVVSGLGFGDEGKGTAVDYLSRQLRNPVVIRATSGPQAAHNVVLPDGTQHTFSQFGSGFFAGADTIYAAPVCDPLSFVREGRALEKYNNKAFGKVIISADSIVSTPYHQAGNRLKEMLRGKGRHGSCGYGINEAVTLASRKHIGLCVGDIFDKSGGFEKRLERVREEYEKLILNVIGHYELEEDKEVENIVEFLISADSVGYVVDLYKEFIDRFTVRSSRDISKAIHNAENKIFESAQGVLLDPNFGFFFPNVTRLSPFDVLKHLEGNDYHHVLCARTYMSRHGAGPFLSEDDTEGYDPHNVKNEWQGQMRYGCLDMPSLAYAIDVVKKHGMLVRPKLFVTHADVVNSGRYVSAYNGQSSIGHIMDDALKVRNFSDPKGGKEIGSELIKVLNPEHKESDNFVAEMEQSLGVKVGWVSSGMTWKDKVEV